MAQNVKKGHYIPQFYLSTFAKDGRIWVYDKDSKKSAYPSNIKDVACENYFYDLGEPGKRDDFAENEFSKLESVLATSYRESLIQLANGIAPDEHMEGLAALIAFTLLRTKERREWLLNGMLESANQFFKHSTTQENLRKILQESDQALTEDRANEILDMVKLKINPEAEARIHLGMLFQDPRMFESIALAILNRDWYVLHFTQDMNYGFWISDAPVVLFSDSDTGPYGLGMWASYTNIAFPLSPKFCLVLGGEGLPKDPSEKRTISVVPCTKEMVDGFNFRQCIQAHRFIYPCTSNTFLLRRIIKNCWGKNHENE